MRLLLVPPRGDVGHARRAHGAFGRFAGPGARGDRVRPLRPSPCVTRDAGVPLAEAGAQRGAAGGGAPHPRRRAVPRRRGRPGPGPAPRARTGWWWCAPPTCTRTASSSAGGRGCAWRRCSPRAPTTTPSRPRWRPCSTRCSPTSAPASPACGRPTPNTHYLPVGYDPAQHGPQMNGEAPAHDVVFVGTGFESRVALLSQVDWSGIDLGLYGAWAEVPAGPPPGAPPPPRPGGQRPRRGALPQGPHRAQPVPGHGRAPRRRASTPGPTSWPRTGCSPWPSPGPSRRSAWGAPSPPSPPPGELEEAHPHPPGRRLEAPPHGRGPPRPGRRGHLPPPRRPAGGAPDTVTKRSKPCRSTTAGTAPCTSRTSASGDAPRNCSR